MTPGRSYRMSTSTLQPMSPNPAGMVTSVWFAHALGLEDLIRFTPDYCGVSRMLASSSADVVTVRSFNETHFLGPTHVPLF